MPSVWSAVTPESTAFGLASFGVSTSVIALSLLPLSTLQPEPRDQDGGEQERDHRGGDGGTLSQVAAADGALITERRHKMRGIGRAAAREHPDELEIGEGEQHRERHHHRDDRSEQRISDVAKPLPRRRPVDGGGLVERGRNRLQAGEERDRHERYATPDVGEDDGPARVPGIAEKIDIGRDQPELA